MEQSRKFLMLLPAMTQAQIPLLRLINIRNSQETDLWNNGVDSLLMATFSFFLIELAWFVFGRKVLGIDSGRPFWSKFLRLALTDLKAVLIIVAALTFFSIIFALMVWGADFLTEKHVAHFGFYLTLSLLLNFYSAALFSLWHLFLAPRLSAKRKLTFSK